jgi:hypothetical protein
MNILPFLYTPRNTASTFGVPGQEVMLVTIIIILHVNFRYFSLTCNTFCVCDDVSEKYGV